MGWMQKWSRCGTGIHVRHDVKVSGKLNSTRMSALNKITGRKMCEMMLKYDIIKFPWV
jgi:hypothetical protein